MVFFNDPLRCPEPAMRAIEMAVGNGSNGAGRQVAWEIGGVSHTTVGKIAKAAGIALDAAGSGKRLSAEKRAQIIGALKANPNAAEVAKQIGGVTRVGVWMIAKAAGIELTAGKAARDHRPN